MRKTIQSILSGLIVFGLVAVWCALPQTSYAANSQSIGVPLYAQPDKSTFWDDVRAAGASSVPFVIANPSNGPGTIPLPAYVSALGKNDSANIKTLGYVQTNFQSRAFKESYRDIDAWYRLYPNIKGIMIDSVKQGGAAEVCYVAGLYSHIKRIRPNDLVVVNAGGHISDVYEPYGDIFVNAATDYESYLAWTPQYRSFESKPENQNRFWHIVYGVKPDQYSSVFEKLRTNNAGWMYFTDRPASSPFSGTPSFWQNEAADVGALPPTAIPNRGITSLPRGCISLSASADNSIDTTTAKRSLTTSSLTVNNTSQGYDSEAVTTVEIMGLPKGATVAHLYGGGWSCAVESRKCAYEQNISAGSSLPKVSIFLEANCDYAGGDATLRLTNYTGNRWDVKLPVRAPFGCDAATSAGKLNPDSSGQIAALTTQSVETTPENAPLVEEKKPALSDPNPKQTALPMLAVIMIIFGSLLLMALVGWIGWVIYRRKRYSVRL
jgi:hypothetical protein